MLIPDIATMQPQRLLDRGAGGFVPDRLALAGSSAPDDFCIEWQDRR